MALPLRRELRRSCATGPRPISDCLKQRDTRDTSLPMTRRHLVLLPLLAAGCFELPGQPGTRLGTYTDAGVSGSARCRTLVGAGQVCSAVPATESCGGVQCSTGEECCQTTERCVPIGDTATCPRYPSTWPSESSPRACSARSDCGEDEFCMPDDGTCAGSGHCQSITDCGYCNPVGAEVCEVCGCNGVTYPSTQHACVAGVMPAPSRGGCGKVVNGRPDLIACGNDSHCPGDARCCLRTRACHPLAEPWRCDPGQDCDDDQECVDRAAEQGRGTAAEYFCRRDSCALQPGTCSPSSSLASTCASEVQTVCGCDGVTYSSRCRANAARTNVASSGPCP